MGTSQAEAWEGLPVHEDGLAPLEELEEDEGRGASLGGGGGAGFLEGGVLVGGGGLQLGGAAFDGNGGFLLASCAGSAQGASRR